MKKPYSTPFITVSARPHVRYKIYIEEFQLQYYCIICEKVWYLTNCACCVFICLFVYVIKYIFKLINFLVKCPEKLTTIYSYLTLLSNIITFLQASSDIYVFIPRLAV